MKSGPPPQPGSVRSRKRAALEADATPRPPTAPPEPPPYLSEVAATVWRETCDRLSALRLLDGCDKNLLECYCESVSRHRAACKELEAAGVVGVSDRGGQSVHPSARLAQQAAESARKLSGELGLTAAARLRLNKPEGEREVSELTIFRDQPRRFQFFMQHPDLEKDKEWVYRLSPDDYDRWLAAQEEKIAESQPGGPRPVKGALTTPPQRPR